MALKEGKDEANDNLHQVLQLLAALKLESV